MVNISRHTLNPRVVSALREQFRTLAATGDVHAWEALLSDAEQLMLQKRLVTVLFLAAGFSQYRIQQLLKLSPDTIARIADSWKEGAFKDLEKLLKLSFAPKPRRRSDDVDAYYDHPLVKLLHGGLPAYTDRRRR